MIATAVPWLDFYSPASGDFCLAAAWCLSACDSDEEEPHKSVGEDPPVEILSCATMCVDSFTG